MKFTLNTILSADSSHSELSFECQPKPGKESHVKDIVDRYSQLMVLGLLRTMVADMIPHLDMSASYMETAKMHTYSFDLALPELSGSPGLKSSEANDNPEDLLSKRAQDVSPPLGAPKPRVKRGFFSLAKAKAASRSVDSDSSKCSLSPRIRSEDDDSSCSMSARAKQLSPSVSFRFYDGAPLEAGQPEGAYKGHPSASSQDRARDFDERCGSRWPSAKPHGQLPDSECLNPVFEGPIVKRSSFRERFLAVRQARAEGFDDFPPIDIMFHTDQ
jgi:hypothetical protein